MRIGIDVDDVLFPWSTIAHQVCERAGITNGRQITQWDFARDYGCSSDELWEVIDDAYRDGMLRENAPIAGAAQALRDLRRAGHTVHIVTARGMEGSLAAQVRKDTAYWLTRNEIEHDSLTFTKDKTVLRLDLAADDGPRNVAALEGAGVPTYLVESIHNRTFEHTRRVPSIVEFAAAVLG